MRHVARAEQLAIAVAAAALMMVWAAAPVGGADLDLETVFNSAPETAAPGATATYSVDYTNHGAADAANCRLRLLLPPGLFLDWSSATIDQVESSFTDSLGNLVDVRLDEDTCDNMLVSVESAGGGPPSLPAATTGRFSVDIPLPATIPTVGTLTVDSPQSVAGMYDFARGSCTDCGDPSSCFGGPLSTKTAVTADMELVNDPTPEAGQTPSMGCHALEGFTAGRIALVRRGSCGFGVKALNAQQAGAAGVVIVNDEARQSQNLHSIAMSGGTEGAAVTVPVVMVGYTPGEALIAAVEAKARVIATLGGVQSEDLPFTATAYHAPGSPDTDADGLNDSATAVTAVDYVSDEAPEAAFTFSPTTPIKGQAVHFVDASANDPTTWSWDFGDGVGTSDEQNPVYSYAEPGTYTVTLTASNGFGSDSISDELFVAGIIQNRHDTFVPAAAVAAGDQGAFFLTDLEINNRGATPMIYQLVWLPRAEDNTAVTISDAYMLAPGNGVRYANVLDSVFGLTDALGALAVTADTDNALVMSRTFNQTEAKVLSTFGQSIPGVPAGDMIATGQRRRILFMTEDDDYRSNLGCQNGAATDIRIMAQLFAADGTSLELRPIDLKPRSNNQINRIFKDYAPVADGYVDVWTDTPDATFFCYGSVLDNQTSDPTTILPQ